MVINPGDSSEEYRMAQNPIPEEWCTKFPLTKQLVSLKFSIDGGPWLTPVDAVVAYDSQHNKNSFIAVVDMVSGEITRIVKVWP